MSLSSLFHRQAAVVRDTPTVSVVRELNNEQHIIYRKRFRASGFDIWAERENQFFGLFSFKKLNKVVRPETIKNTEQGGVAEVVTFDAGLTIEEWLQVGAKLDNKTLSQPFLLGEYWLRLAQACLLALQEIHVIGVIHCDIKPDNICLPYLPKKLSPNLSEAIAIDFEHIRLIDFSFSLSKDIPLHHATLPINSQHPSAAYLAPSFRKAVLSDQNQQQAHEVNKLDYHVDLYSLGYLLNKLLNQEGMVWQPQQQLFAQQLVLELMNPGPSDQLPHAAWLQQLAEQLSAWPQVSRFEITTPPAQRQEQIAPTPILATPIIGAAAGATPIAQVAETSKPVNNSKPPKTFPIKTILFLALLGAGGAWALKGNVSPPPVKTHTQQAQAEPKVTTAEAAPAEAEPSILDQIFSEPVAAMTPAETSSQPCDRCPVEAQIPAGSFQMGSQNQAVEQPVHEVTIAYSFAVTKYEITVAEYLACVSDGVCREPEWNEFGSDYHYQTGTNDLYRQISGALRASDHPIVGISWSDANRYANWLSQQTGLHYRLPSEAEWEYACRANHQTAYCGSDDWDEVASHGSKPQKVGQQKANDFGLFDMSGNVSEWVADNWTNNYLLTPNDGSAFGNAQNKYTKRGGSWKKSARATARSAAALGERDVDIGFRLARALD